MRGPSLRIFEIGVIVVVKRLNDRFGQHKRGGRSSGPADQRTSVPANQRMDPWGALNESRGRVIVFAVKIVREQISSANPRHN